MGSGFHLTWRDNSSEEQEFAVQQRIGAGAFSELARVPFNSTQFHVAGGQAGTPHAFRVIAVGSGASSAPSEEVVWTP